jgi:uncharacterized SAM-binding protein YcdF (DUF218 family)
MFPFITTILLWVLIVLVLWYVLTKLVSRKSLSQIGVVLLLLVIILAFFNPTNTFGSTWWNLLSLPLKPLGLGIVLLGFALREGAKKAKGDLVAIAFFVLLIGSTPLFAVTLGQWAASGANQNVTTEERLPPSTIVILARGTTKISLVPRREVQLTERGDRLLAASQAYNQEVFLGRQPLVIISSGRRPGIPLEQPNVIEANDLRVIMNRSFNIPLSQLVPEPTGVDVRTSAEAVFKILQEKNLQNQPIILIASGLEMRRAIATFSQLKIKAFPRSTDFTTGNVKPVNLNNIVVEDLVPNVDALALTSRIIDEYFVRIYYFLRGWQGNINDCCYGGL